MNKIRDWLYIGKYRETTQKALLDAYHISALLHLAENVQHEGIQTLYLPVDDGGLVAPDKLKQGIDFICEQKTQGKIVMSACGAGISRSTTFAMGALMQIEQLGLWDAYHAILVHHPDAMPHYQLLISLANYHKMELSELSAAEKTMEIFLIYQRRK